MPHISDLPGFDRALDILSGTTLSSDDAFDDVLDGVDPDDPCLGARPTPRTPDTALDALMALRLGALESNAGLDGLSPDPGTITVLRAAEVHERERLKDLIEQSDDIPDTMVRLQPGAGGGGIEREQFHREILKNLLKGRRVLVVADLTTPVPDDLSLVVMQEMRCPDLTPDMLSAVVTLLHGMEVTVPGGRLPDLDELRLAAIFAAPTPEAALATLMRFRAPQRRGQDAITLDSVHGQTEAVEMFDQLVDDLDGWRAGEIAWAEVTASVLMSGPPGTGKTLLAQAVAGSAAAHFVKTGYAECQKAGHQGDMLRALYAAADQAIVKSPSVFFVDEIDSFFSRAQSSNGYIVGVVNGLLTLLDRLNATPGVIVIAATNFVENVDPAITRAGRFDRHVQVGPLDRGGVRSMLRAELPPGLATDKLLDRLGDQLTGMTGAQIGGILREARTRARRARRDLGEAHLTAAAGAAARPLDRDVLFRMALHEAGHLLIGHLAGLPAAHTARITATGGEVARPMPRVLTQNTVAALMRLHLAGRAAEQVALGDVSNGAGGGPRSDLALATDLAIRAELEYGLGHDLIWQPTESAHRLMPERLRRVVQDRLRHAERAVRADLETYRADLDRIAHDLMDKRELNADDLKTLLARVPFPDTRPQRGSPPAATM